MSLIPYDPFQGLRSLQGELDRFFDQRAGGKEDDEIPSRQWAPRVDIHEDKERFVINADLPGVDPKAVKVEVREGRLWLSGERKVEKEEKGRNYHRVERSYGHFSRIFQLPDSADTNGVGADYKNGVLTINIPKREEVKPKAIEVKVAS